jgi:DNA polymerase-3 subunit delta'
LPAVDARALHGLGDALAGNDPQPLASFVDAVNAWLSARLNAGAQGAEAVARLARLAAAWEHVNRTAREVEVFNLERKPMVFSVFDALAEATQA